MAIDLGLNDPVVRERFAEVLEEIRQLGEELDRVGSDPQLLHRAGSKIGELIVGLPEPHVDIRQTMVSAVHGLRGSLDTVAVLITSGLAPSPEALGTLSRTVLLASCRLLVLVGPADIERCRENAVRVMLQEARSLGHLYRRAAAFTELRALVPPTELVEMHARRHEALRAEGLQPFSEIEMVELAADIVTERILAKAPERKNFPTARVEHLVWIYNTYSGVAHAFAWPGTVVRSGERLPGDFVTDFGTTVAIAGLAVQAFLEATR